MAKTKAQMLRYLKSNLPEVNILPLFTVFAGDFSLHETDVLISIEEYFGSNVNHVIVRSSCKNEDKEDTSNAGKYISLPRINLHNRMELKEAIKRVFDSYGEYSDEEEVLVQPFLEDSIKSGVVFTSDIETLAPYYTVNYFDGSDTEAVTSGANAKVRTLVCFKGAIDRVKDKVIRHLLYQCEMIEKFLCNAALDIEFGVTSQTEVIIFQVRMIVRGNKKTYDTLKISEVLERIYKKVEKLNQRHPFLLGECTHFGVMPDWNPAEILGMRPKKLAVSLYKELITDNIWARQRAAYGYRDLSMHPLMVLFCGLPYIDTRITFNSFVPDALDNRIAEKLVNYYLESLRKIPAYHDKIEFEIVYSCYYFGLAKKLKLLLNCGFNENEIKRIEFALLSLTNQVIHPLKGLYKQDIKKIEELIVNHERILEADISTVDKIYWLIEECKKYGTLPFAGVARAAFMAVQFLNSLVSEGIITSEQKNSFLHSLNLITDKMKADLAALGAGKISREDFLSNYGHIRPGTYDILSERYDEAFDKYFTANNDIPTTTLFDSYSNSVFPENVLQRIDEELIDNGIDLSADQLLLFMREAIEGREYLKFVFTRCVSDILKLLCKYGQRLGIDKTELAYLDISVVKQLYTDLFAGDVKEVFLENIKKNKIQYLYEEQLKLPSLIIEPDSVYSFFQLQDEPNYITQKVVTGRPLLYDVSKSLDVEDRIVFIKSADPGYDFLFLKNIAGLVTQFGGANSHMAIRCAESGIPAIIGAGEDNFIKWSNANKIKIDCQGKLVVCF